MCDGVVVYDIAAVGVRVCVALFTMGCVLWRILHLVDCVYRLPHASWRLLCNAGRWWRVAVVCRAYCSMCCSLRVSYCLVCWMFTDVIFQCRCC